MALTTEEQLWMARHERASMLEDFLFVEGINDRLIAFLIAPPSRMHGFVVRLPARPDGYLGGEDRGDGSFEFIDRGQAIEALYVAAGIRGVDGLMAP